jgi:hypothetical protein
VLKEVVALPEELPTLTALIKLFSSVDSLVPSKRVSMDEHFPTLTTLMMPLSRVKILPKLSVLMHLHPAGRGLVLRKAKGDKKSHSTLPMCIGLL